MALYSIGLLVMIVAFLGHTSNLDCSSEATLPTYLYLVGALIFGGGLFLRFYKSTKSYVKASTFSILLVMVILVIGFFLAVASQPDGVFHCYEF